MHLQSSQTAATFFWFASSLFWTATPSTKEEPPTSLSHRNNWTASVFVRFAPFLTMELVKRDEDGLSLSDDQQLEALTVSSVANLMRAQDAELLASHHALGINEQDDENDQGHMEGMGRQDSFEKASLCRESAQFIIEGTAVLEKGLPTPRLSSSHLPASPSDHHHLDDGGAAPF